VTGRQKIRPMTGVLEETIEIATPDFRFYELTFAAHYEQSS
jgi:hypothetical protein